MKIKSQGFSNDVGRVSIQTFIERTHKQSIKLIELIYAEAISDARAEYKKLWKNYQDHQEFLKEEDNKDEGINS